jgi:hypothetical protein
VLDVSAQWRKVVRLTVCLHVTQHHVWRSMLEEMLRGLQADVSSRPPVSGDADDLLILHV